jgi:hypothetical protein
MFRVNGRSRIFQMRRLELMIAAQPFRKRPDLILTYSNWESASIRPSESFESLSAGVQSDSVCLGHTRRRTMFAYGVTRSASALTSNDCHRDSLTNRCSGTPCAVRPCCEKSAARSSAEEPASAICLSDHSITICKLGDLRIVFVAPLRTSASKPSTSIFNKSLR